MARSSRLQFVYPAAEAGDITISVPTGSLSLSGKAPESVNSGDTAVTREPGVGAITLTGSAPTIVINHIRAPPKGELALSGLAPTVTYDWVVSPDKGSLTLVGQAPSLTQDIIITAGVGSLTLTGYAPVTINGFIITDVDTDESVFDGQTGVVVSLAGEGISASGKRCFIVQGGNWVEQEVTLEDASSVTITVSFGGHSTGAAELYVWDPV